MTAEDDHSDGAAAVDVESDDDFSEAGDGFDVGGPLLDPRSMAMVEERSVATTQLASAVGSTVGMPKDAFLKSITFCKPGPDDEEIEWGFDLKQGSDRKKPRIVVTSIRGIITRSKITVDDYIKSINGQRCGPSLNPERALQRMMDCYEKDGYLSVETANKEGDDVLVEATIIKPRPDMTYKEAGIEVWYWGFLELKLIKKDSIFRRTALKAGDHVININDIKTDEMKPESFAHVFDNLDGEITLTVLRRKQRFSGMWR